MASCLYLDAYRATLYHLNHMDVYSDCCSSSTLRILMSCDELGTPTLPAQEFPLNYRAARLEIRPVEYIDSGLQFIHVQANRS